MIILELDGTLLIKDSKTNQYLHKVTFTKEEILIMVIVVMKEITTIFFGGN